MGKIVVTEFITIDGIIEDPGGSEGHPRGGWALEIPRGEGEQFKLEETLGSDALLLGRRTYEGFAQSWPERDGPFADKFNAMPKYVVTSRPLAPEWANSTALGGDLAQEVGRLRQRHDRDVVVHGSARLTQALLDQELVDELRLMVFPLVLGSGKRLFTETAAKQALRLAGSRTVGEGVVILVYRRA